MAEIKDRQQIILLHGAGEFNSTRATELELVKGELVIEHGTNDVKLHTLDNSGNLATIISENAVGELIDAKLLPVTTAQAEKDAAQDLAITDGDAATLASAKEYADAEIKKVTDAQALIDAAQDKAITDGDAATLASAKEYADAELKKVTDAQAEKDAAQDLAITDGDAATLASAKEYADAELKKVTDAQTLIDAAQDKAITDGDAATLASAKEYTDGLSIAYDSDAKEIKLMSGETQIGTAIDATDFIKDGMVSNAELVAGEGDDEGKMFIEITFNSDAESDPIRIDVSSLVDAGAIAELDARVTANSNAIANIKTAIGDWTAEKQAGVDEAQDLAITDGDAATLASAKEYADAEIKKVTDAQAEVDAAQNAILAGYGTEEGETATVKVDIDNLQGQIDNLQGQIDDIVEDTTYLKEVEVVDPNNSIVVTPSDNKVTIDFTKLVINGGEY